MMQTQSRLASYSQKMKNILPGLILCAAITGLAKVGANYSGMPVMLLALVMGLIAHFAVKGKAFKAGIQTSSKRILKIGVILLGARIMFSDVIALGITPLVITIISCAAVIGLSIYIAKRMKCDQSLGILVGGATAICGASAALAISTLLPKDKNLEKNTLFAVIGATAIGTCAMIFYPVILQWVELDARQAGFLIGGTIHDVSQVVGAGYSVSDEVGDQAILVKLTRVFMLVPVIFFFMSYNKKHLSADEKPEFPYFLIAFAALVSVNSLGIIPSEISAIMAQASKWALVMGLTAVGMKTSLAGLFSLGWKPFILLLADTAVISGLYILTLALGLH